ncbi:hypothetical protein CCR94_12065 [Rhodoblastus sphagnicola]|uniref:Uncharacterized protein n=1 Tax=Rhodoblastus sphagnicola TaxID=333368 RepID=A0A2S6N7N3_9HYPH|nr:hypothetical protein CCR94_12065 [Rhodoblastus sphagnicola]
MLIFTACAHRNRLFQMKFTSCQTPAPSILTHEHVGRDTKIRGEAKQIAPGAHASALMPSGRPHRARVVSAIWRGICSNRAKAAPRQASRPDCDTRESKTP